MRKLTEITELPDGGFEITSRILSKLVRAPNGQIQKIYSLDGEVWAKDIHKIQSSMERSEQLHPGFIARKMEPLDTGSSAGTPRQDIVTLTKHGRMPSRSSGKTPRKRPREPFMAPPAATGHHSHRCHGRTYQCACQAPYFKRPCGGAMCLRERKTNV